jgi:hypothetical protein
LNRSSLISATTQRYSCLTLGRLWAPYSQICGLGRGRTPWPFH